MVWEENSSEIGEKVFDHQNILLIHKAGQTALYGIGYQLIKLSRELLYLPLQWWT